MKNVMKIPVTEVSTLMRLVTGQPLTVEVVVGDESLGLSFTTSAKKAPRVGDVLRVTYEWGEDE